MKKLLICFSVLLLALIGIGCSNDDNDSSMELKELIVKLDKMAIEEGETLKFTAVDSDNNEVTNVDFYVNSIKVGNQYKFERSGAYNVIAMRSGYITSSPKTILVGNAVVDKLELVPSKIEITVNETMTFKTMVNGVDILDSYIMIAGQGLLLGNVWQANKIGTYKFYAFKGGYLNSNEIEVTVKPKEVIDSQSFTYAGVKYSVEKSLLAPHALNDPKEGDPQKQFKPYNYTDKSSGKMYQIYELYMVNQTHETAVILILGVYVRDNETEFKYPYLANKADVFTIVGAVDVKENLVFKYAVSDIDEINVAWLKPFDSEKEEAGIIKHTLKLKNNELEVNYEGDFYGNVFREIVTKSNTPNTKKLNYRDFKVIRGK